MDHKDEMRVYIYQNIHPLKTYFLIISKDLLSICINWTQQEGQAVYWIYLSEINWFSMSTKIGHNMRVRQYVEHIYQIYRHSRCFKIGHVCKIYLSDVGIQELDTL